MNLPAPPLYPLSPTTETVAAIAMALWISALTAWIFISRTPKHHRACALLLIASCGIAGFLETSYSRLTNMQFFHTENHPIVYTAWFQEFPLWAFLAVWAWPTSMAYLTVVVLDSDRPAKNLWKLFTGFVIFDFAAECIFIRTGFFNYPGSQALEVFGLPFIWPFVYTTIFMVLGMVVYHFALRVSGLRRLIFLPVSGGVMMGGITLGAGPTVVGIGMNLSTPWLTILSVGSAAITFVSLDAAIRSGILLKRPTGAANNATSSDRIPHGRIGEY